MRFHELIFESTFELLYDAEEAAKILYGQCEPWLEATDGEYVYRGLKSYPEDVIAFVKTTRTDRKPKDTPEDRSSIFNSLIKHVGGTANRNNSVFVTSSLNVAREYGKIFYCFPIGKFKYTWSPYWSDWTNDLDWTELGTLKNFDINGLVQSGGYREFASTSARMMADPKNVKMDRLRECIKVNEGLLDAIKESHEIMVQCESALYVDLNHMDYVRKHAFQ